MPYAKVTDFISIDPTTIIATLINLLILFLIFRLVLFKRVNKVIEDRQKDIADSYEEADETKRRAAVLEAEYNEKLVSAKEESANIIRESTKRAQARGDQIIDEAKTEAQNIITTAHNEAEREKKRAVNSVKNEITDIAFSVAQTLVEKEITKEDNERLIDAFIDSVGEDND
ncbi:MAG: F0F1 ATP synthase subunit B [Oscillospiraceae bacterium]|nr:F0F1 ATP synthase subunit B [Oscillospiraceae bacterium]